MNWLSVFASSFLLSLLLTPLIRKLALRCKIVDYPNERKIHLHPTPLLGGVVIYIAFTVAVLFNFHFSLPLKGIMLGASFIMLMGLIDDIRSIPASVRLAVQVLTALVLIRYGVMVTFLPNVLWGKIGEIIITILWVVGITNALNFLDGMDGLASGLVVIAAGIFFVIAIQTEQLYLGYLTIALAGATLGFIPYNFYPARIFLGDSGSSFLGFSLASLAMMGGWAENNPMVALSVPLLVLGVPIFDMIYITAARIKQRKVTNFRSWIEYVGKDHLHHRLFNLGFGQRQVVFFIYMLSLCLGLSAVALTSTFTPPLRARVGFTNTAVLLLLQAALIFLVITILMHPVKKK